MATPVRFELPVHPANLGVVAATLLNAGAHGHTFNLEVTYHPSPVVWPEHTFTTAGVARLLAFLWTVDHGLDAIRVTLEVLDDAAPITTTIGDRPAYRGLAELLLASRITALPTGRTDPRTGALRALCLEAEPRPIDVDEATDDDAPPVDDDAAQGLLDGALDADPVPAPDQG